uniref:Uncharacterized protein n=1 Tax=Zea mays TaxID=4577 RepID=A0A804NND3_MAIZE
MASLGARLDELEEQEKYTIEWGAGKKVGGPEQDDLAHIDCLVLARLWPAQRRRRLPPRRGAPGMLDELKAFGEMPHPKSPLSIKASWFHEN